MTHHTIQSHIGDDTEVTVHFEYEPGQPEKMSGPSSIWQRGEPENVTVESIVVDGTHGAIQALLDLHHIGDDDLDRIKQECWDAVRKMKDKDNAMAEG